MPYASNDELPKGVKDALPAGAQSIFRNAYNSAAGKYDTEDRRMSIAWGAVKNAGWSKDKDGNWHKTTKIIVKNETQRYTLGIVYEPDSPDTDDDWSTPEELEKGCWDFMRRIQGRGEVNKAAVSLIAQIMEAVDKDGSLELEVTEAFDEIAKAGVNAMHAEDLDDCEVVECYIAPVDMTIGKETIKKGTWLAGIIWSEKYFAKIQNGEWTGYSMGGWAKKISGEEHAE